MSERRFNAALAHRLDVPERVTWLPPDEVMNALDIRPGETVADIGAGTGYFTLPLAKAVGSRGKVYAVDAQEKMLELLSKKLDALPAPNIELLQAEGDATYLSSAVCNLVFFSNVWHEFADRESVLRESKRILTDFGRIAILDWRPDVKPEHGPPLEHRLSAASASTELLSAGFKRPSFQNIGKYAWLVRASAG